MRIFLEKIWQTLSAKLEPSISVYVRGLPRVSLMLILNIYEVWFAMCSKIRHLIEVPAFLTFVLNYGPEYGTIYN